jgi:hypothetical protein
MAATAAPQLGIIFREFYLNLSWRHLNSASGRCNFLLYRSLCHFSSPHQKP